MLAAARDLVWAAPGAFIVGLTWREVVATAPVSFILGLLVGFWLGARYDLRKKRDV